MAKAKILIFGTVLGVFGLIKLIKARLNAAVKGVALAGLGVLTYGDAALELSRFLGLGAGAAESAATVMRGADEGLDFIGLGLDALDVYDIMGGLFSSGEAVAEPDLSAASHLPAALNMCVGEMT